ncbi:MAG: 2-hydroxyacid dehydrogenase [Casimicrobiaceae bacterium]
MPTVLYLSHATPDVYAIIRDAAPPSVRLLTLERNDDDERKAKLREAEVVIVASHPFRAPLIDAARQLRLVHHQGVGWQDTVDHALLRERHIPLATTPEGTTTGVAEHTVLLMLACCKLLPFADRELREGRFHINALRPRSRELAGMTVGYVGFGRIGQAVAKRLRAFETRGIYHDAAVTLEAAVERDLDVRHVPLATLLREADVVSLHVPLTPATRNLIGRDAIATMKPGAILVNTARGGIIDEDALAEALADGRVGAAGLDVFAQEPPDPTHPLFQLANVVVTPHISAGTRDAMTTKMRALFANVERFFRGEPLANEVRL